jgi:hypothetical protein
MDNLFDEEFEKAYQLTLGEQRQALDAWYERSDFDRRQTVRNTDERREQEKLSVPISLAHVCQ